MVSCGTMEDANVFYGHGGTRSSEQAHSGTYSYRWLCGTTTSLHLINDRNGVKKAPMSPSDIFYCEFWIRGHTSNTVNTGTARIQAVSYGATGGGHSTLQGPPVNLGTSLNGGWTKVAGFLANDTWTDVLSADWYITLASAAAGEVYYLDDIVVYRVSEAAQTNQSLYNANTPASTVDATKIGGTFVAGQIPSLATSKITDLDTTFDQMGQVLTGTVVTPVNSWVTDISQFFSNLLGWQQTANATAVAAISNTSQRNPTWVCRYPVADVSYPESMNVMFQVAGDTGAATAGTAHTHNMSAGTASADGYSVALDNSRGAYITCSATVAHTHVMMALWRAAGSQPNNVFIDVFRENASGALTRIDSINVAASITTSAAMEEFELTTPIVVQAGERYLVRLRNKTTVATTVYAQYITRTATMDRTGWWTGTAAATDPASYSTADASTHRASTSRVTFAALASPTASAADAAYSDDFNDRSSLGGTWSLKTSVGSTNLMVSSGEVWYNGLSNGTQVGTYIFPTSSDRMFAEGKMGGASILDGGRSGIYICADREFAQVVTLMVNATGSKIYSGGWNTLTQRASTATGGVGTYSLEYNPATKVYTARKNSVSIATWTDSGDLMSHGSDYRYGGLRISMSALATGTVDNFILKDFVP